MIARERRLRDARAAGRVQRRQQHRRLHLGGCHRDLVIHADGLRGAHERHRHQIARACFVFRAEQLQRFQHAAHRALAQRGVAGEHDGDRRGCHRAHHQPRAGARIAEIEDVRWRPPAAYTGAVDMPLSGTDLDRPGAKRPHRPDRVQHILGFEQARDPGLAQRQGAQDQRPVRDRLVARNGCHPLQRGRTARFQWAGLG